MGENIEKLAQNWVSAAPESVDVESDFYCKTRDVFQARLDRMTQNLLREKNVKEGDVYIFSAMAGEIGNNSFDHNMGNLPDVPGAFFAYEILEEKMKVVLSDRGRGVFATLKKVKPSLKSDEEALQTAFTERISGRAPESRGNGLKFVKENLQERKMHLTFFSGNAKAELNDIMEIEKNNEEVKGCLAILTV